MQSLNIQNYQLLTVPLFEVLQERQMHRGISELSSRAQASKHQQIVPGRRDTAYTTTLGLPRIKEYLVLCMISLLVVSMHSRMFYEGLGFALLFFL